jgi:hypothetical protein
MCTVAGLLLRCDSPQSTTFRSESARGSALEGPRDMGQVSFEGYKRRVDGFDYRSRQRDMPRDIATLLELARDIELEDVITVDHEQGDM